MADKVQYDLVSPERLLRSGAADMVVVPGADGDFGVLPGHAPVISTIRPGVIEIHEAGAEPLRIFISGGVCEVSADRCTVLADDVVAVADMDRSDLEQRLKDAEEDLAIAKSDAEAHHAADAVTLLKDMLQAAR
ncbi:MAG: ATP synthase F1 subunit epsilon [Proteobacteria bacterium]|nr:ATP synthase F1 subunit epsilon [Pseudomonadota bacterium]